MLILPMFLKDRALTQNDEKCPKGVPCEQIEENLGPTSGWWQTIEKKKAWNLNVLQVDKQV